MTHWIFEIGAEVQLVLTSEQGLVIGRAEYSEDTPSYVVRYVAADGRQVQAWFTAGALKNA